MKNEKIVMVDGVEWTGRKIAEFAGVAYSTGNRRLNPYIRGKYTKKQLFAQRGKTGGRRRVRRFTIIDGKKWYSKNLAEHLNISVSAAHKRLCKYMNGIYSKEDVFLSSEQLNLKKRVPVCDRKKSVKPPTYEEVKDTLPDVRPCETLLECSERTGASFSHLQMREDEKKREILEKQQAFRVCHTLGGGCIEPPRQ